MSDLSQALKTNKTDQLNADDLLLGPRTIKIREIKVVFDKQTGETKYWVYFEGDDNNPWKPCLGMRRCLGIAWGHESDNYVGRQVTLFNNPSVRFGKDVLGGIQVSHVSDIEKPVSFPMLVQRKKILFTIQPLITKPKAILTPEELEEWKAKIDETKTVAALGELSKAIKAKDFDASGAPLVAYGTKKMGELRNE